MWDPQIYHPLGRYLSFPSPIDVGPQIYHPLGLSLVPFSNRCGTSQIHYPLGLPNPLPFGAQPLGPFFNRCGTSRIHHPLGFSLSLPLQSMWDFPQSTTLWDPHNPPHSRLNSSLAHCPMSSFGYHLYHFKLTTRKCCPISGFPSKFSQAHHSQILS